MVFKISEFRSAFPKGLARPNLWYAEIYVTSSVSSETIANFKFRCEKADLPGRSVATVDDVGSGPALKIPYDINYNDAEITIICGNDFSERKYFEDWINKIVTPARNPTNPGLTNSGLINYYSNYAKGNTLALRQINDEGDTTIQYTLHDIYPISISPMNLSWEESNTYQRFSVTFNYRHYSLNKYTT